MGGCKSLMLFLAVFSFCFGEMRTRDFDFVSLCYGRSGEEIGTGYAMAASGRMQYDYKQTNKPKIAWLRTVPGDRWWAMNRKGLKTLLKEGEFLSMGRKLSDYEFLVMQLEMTQK